MLHENSRYLFEEYPERGGCFPILVAFICILIACVLVFSSCSSGKTIIMPQVKTEHVHDTTLLHDSIYVDRVRTEYVKGDTVFRKDSVFLYRYKYLDKVQVVERTDTIPYKVEVEKPIRVRNWYDKGTSIGFWLLFLAFLACAALKVARLYLLHKT